MKLQPLEIEITIMRLELELLHLELELDLQLFVNHVVLASQESGSHLDSLLLLLFNAYKRKSIKLDSLLWGNGHFWTPYSANPA